MKHKDILHMTALELLNYIMDKEARYVHGSYYATISTTIKDRIETLNKERLKK